MKKVFNMPKPNISCEYAMGYGADYVKCKKTSQNCQYQHWCTNKRLFEQIGETACKEYKKK